MTTERIGQQLGNYQLVQLLGRGGFAEVYLGQHTRLSTPAAIKILLARLASSEEVQQFEREARTIAQLRHPQIVRVLDFDVQNEIPFLVLDYAPGGTLRQRHPAGTRLPLTQVLSYVQQLAPALQYAHEQRIIHRDIKPENMLIGEHGEILLSDFGIAVLAQSSRYQSMSTQDVAGTAAYMAPEQLQGKPRPASDQYALAVVVYEWLCGTRPFHGSFSEIAAQHVLTPPPPLREKGVVLPAEVEQVLLTALAKAPEQRFASVQAFALALEQAVQQAPRTPTTKPAPAPQVLPTLPAQPAPQAAMPPASPSPFPPTSPHPLVEQIASGSMPPSVMTDPVEPPRRSEAGTKLHPHPTRRVVLLAGLGVVSLACGLTWWLSRAPSRAPAPEAPLFTYRGHRNVVNAVAWSPDGKRLASASGDRIVGDSFASVDNTVQVWDAASGGTVFICRGQSDVVYAVAWSPDSKRLASASEDRTVQVWDATNGNHLFTYRGHGEAVYAVAWSPDGKRLASASLDQTVQVWDATNRNHVFTYRGHGEAVYAVAWSPDGKRIASASADDTVQVWDAADGGHAFTYRYGHDSVSAVAWSPDGKRIASASADQTVQVWDAAGDSYVFTYRGHGEAVYAVAWSPDGRRLASASADDTVQVWDAADGNHVFTYRGHSSNVNAVAWSPDGKRLASASADGTVQVWAAK